LIIINCIIYDFFNTFIPYGFNLYRKAAQQWHPDNFQGDEKKVAEKKFIDIAAAKEVLTDPEKRQKYDNGEDPLDPESQQGQGFNPFQQGGFHSFHGQQFKFHFN